MKMLALSAALLLPASAIAECSPEEAKRLVGEIVSAYNQAPSRGSFSSFPYALDRGAYPVSSPQERMAGMAAKGLCADALANASAGPDEHLFCGEPASLPASVGGAGSGLSHRMNYMSWASLMSMPKAAAVELCSRAVRCLSGGRDSAGVGAAARSISCGTLK